MNPCHIRHVPHCQLVKLREVRLLQCAVMIDIDLCKSIHVNWKSISSAILTVNLLVTSRGLWQLSKIPFHSLQISIMRRKAFSVLCYITTFLSIYRQIWFKNRRAKFRRSETSCNICSSTSSHHTPYQAFQRDSAYILGSSVGLSNHERPAFLMATHVVENSHQGFHFPLYGSCSPESST